MGRHVRDRRGRGLALTRDGFGCGPSVGGKARRRAGGLTEAGQKGDDPTPPAICDILVKILLRGWHFYYALCAAFAER